MGESTGWLLHLANILTTLVLSLHWNTAVKTALILSYCTHHICEVCIVHHTPCCGERFSLQGAILEEAAGRKRREEKEEKEGEKGKKRKGKYGKKGKKGKGRKRREEREGKKEKG